MKYYKDALYVAADQAYESEVVQTDMEHIVIGDGNSAEFSSRKEWIEARVTEWLEEAALERAQLARK